MSTFSISYNITGTNSLTPILKNISSDFEKLQKKMEVPFQKFEKLASTGASAMLKITAPLTLGIGMALKQFSQFENLEVGITTSLVNKGQTMQEAQRFVKELTTFAKNSPFETFDLMREAGKMSSMGVEMQDIIPTIKMLGDIAGGTGGDFGRLSLAFLQVKAKGKLMGGEINQFAENMFGVRDLLAKELNKTPQEIMAMGEAGLLTFDMLERVMKKATMQGGIFFGAMNNKMKTLQGVFSTFKDSIALMSITIGKKFNDAFNIEGKLSSLSSSIEKLTQTIDKMSPANFKLIASIIGLGIVIPPLLLTIGVLGKAYTTMRLGLGLLVSVQARAVALLPIMRASFMGLLGVLLRVPKALLHIGTSLSVALLNIRQPALGLLMLRMELASLGLAFKGFFIGIGNFAKRFIMPFFLLQALFVSLRGLVKGFTGDSNVGIGKLLSGIMEVGKFINNIIKIALTGIEFVFVKIGQMLAYSMNLLAKIPGLGFLKQEEGKEGSGGMLGSLQKANTFLQDINQEARYKTKLDKMPEQKQNAEIKSDVKIVLESPTPVKVKTVENETSYSRGNFSIVGTNKSNQYVLGQ